MIGIVSEGCAIRGIGRQALQLGPDILYTKIIARLEISVSKDAHHQEDCRGHSGESDDLAEHDLQPGSRLSDDCEDDAIFDFTGKVGRGENEDW